MILNIVSYLQMEDCFPFSIAFASDEGPIRTLADGVLFRKGSSFPSTKILTLHRNDIFNLEAYYANQNELPSGVSTRISSFKVYFSSDYITTISILGRCTWNT